MGVADGRDWQGWMDREYVRRGVVMAVRPGGSG